MSNKKSNLSLLQLLRGIAVVLVVLFHATLMFGVLKEVNYLGGIFKEGRIGVDLFFVLSGFIIFYIHHKDRNENGLARKFYTKRLIRIYPIYWITLLVLVPVYLLVPAFGAESVRSGSVIIKSFLLVPQKMPILNVSWSLSYEILFYLVFGFTLFYKNRKMAITVFAVWMFLSALTLFYVPANFYLDLLFNPFNLEFFYGMIVAYLVLNFTVRYSIPLILVGVAGSILAMYSVIHGIVGIQYRAIVFAIPSAITILGFVSLELVKEIKVPRFFTYLGDASYAIYLTHYPALSVVNKILSVLGLYDKLGTTITITLIVIITIAGGCLFHSLIEKPILNYLRQKLLYAKKGKAAKVALQ